MAIYDISKHVYKKIQGEDSTPGAPYKVLKMQLGKNKSAPKAHLFSSIAVRLFFFILLIADLAWGIFTLIAFVLALVGNAITGFAFFRIKKCCLRLWLNLKRFCVCGLSLVVALLSPALGTMFACTYFLMYDRKGIEEVVPSILQDQFKEFLNPY